MEVTMTAMETTEDEWLRAAARNPAFQDLEAPEEDIYSLEDGAPFRPGPTGRKNPAQG
jgi:hypothetical protein